MGTRKASRSDEAGVADGPGASGQGAGPPDDRPTVTDPEGASTDRGERGDDSRVLVVGGGQVGRRVAERLAADRPVHHVDTEATAVAEPSRHEASHAPDLTRVEALAATGVDAGDVAVVATGADGRNLLVTQLLRTRFGVERVHVLVEDPRTADGFDLPGVEVLPVAEVLSRAVVAAWTDAGEADPGEGATRGAGEAAGR
jgi:hypothetical protein